MSATKSDIGSLSHEHKVPGRTGYSFEVKKGQKFRLTDLEGMQPIDFWVFNKEDPFEYMSVEHTRVHNLSMEVRPGQSAVSNKRRPLVTMIEDNSPGQHDMLLAACDQTRFEGLGHDGYHVNCQDNLHQAITAFGIELPFTPQPWNLFTHFPWTSDKQIMLLSPDTKPGDNITFEAQMDIVVAISACPQDITRICGDENTDVLVEVGS
jgi:uncharacterized protein YcgI (DUF1989 family)